MKVAFLYTLASNQAVFAPYLETLKGAQIIHHVNEQLLKDAQASDDQSEVTKQVHEALERIEESDKPDLIVCTCSTIGAMAEGYSSKVLRVDRAMAEAAVAYQDINVVAAVESTLQPTKRLLDECAEKKGTSPNIELTVVPDAWTEVQKGDLEGYAQAVATYILEKYGAEPKSRESHVIVLAQASMAPAVALVEKARKHQLRMSETNKKMLTLPKILVSPGICMEHLHEQMKGELVEGVED